MRYVIYEDADGLRWRRGIPDAAPLTEARYGTPFGPPDLADLADADGWTAEFHRRLHNQLADRELWSWIDVRRRGGMAALTAAVTSAARADAAKVAAIYQELR
jgi:hypothetical protein